MAWVKIPPEHQPLFHAALPKDKRVTTMNMFGGVAAKANGHMFCGLFGRGAIVRLNDKDQAEALALDGAEMFDPMGNGKASKHTVMLPESVMEEPGELKSWLDRALAHALSLPAKSAAKPASKAKSAATSKPAKTPKPAKASKPAKKLPAAARTTTKRPTRAR